MVVHAGASGSPQRRIRKRWIWLAVIMAFLAVPYLLPKPTPEEQAQKERERSIEAQRQEIAASQEEGRREKVHAAKALYRAKVLNIPSIKGAEWTKKGDFYVFTNLRGSEEEFEKMALTICNALARLGVRKFHLSIMDYEFAKLGEQRTRESKYCL